ncbi:MAG: GIN domain-containing protein [Chitinophagaceae bacterium]
MKLFTFGFFLLLFVVLCSCNKSVIVGSGPIGRVTRNVSAFNGVMTHADIKAVVRYGTTQQVVLEGYENILNITTANIENGTLVLAYNHQYNTIRNSNVVAYIEVPTLQLLNIHGSSEIDASGFLNGQQITTRINGSGTIYLANSAYQQGTFNINGSGNIKARTTPIQQANVNINGSGNVEVHALQSLEVNMHGSGHVRYLGSPQLNINSHGSGSVRRL